MIIINQLKDRLKLFQALYRGYIFYKRISDKIKLIFLRLIAKFKKKEIVHFFHIGKTGGSAIKNAVSGKKVVETKKYIIIFSHSHYFKLNDTLPGEKFFFFVRDPIDRFISGFYSRKRKGMPRIYSAWTAGEEKAFKNFKTPNELAKGLSNYNKKEKAIEAFANIQHLNTSYWYWFGSREYFLSRLNDVVFVGIQKNLNNDFYKLKRKLELPGECILPKDDFNSHKNPANIDKNIENAAYINLKQYYKNDYDFLQILYNNKLV